MDRMSTNKTGYSNITYDKPRDKYRIELRRGGVSMSARADTLPEALAVREQWLTDHPRAPSSAAPRPKFSIVHEIQVLLFD